MQVAGPERGLFSLREKGLMLSGLETSEQWMEDGHGFFQATVEDGQSFPLHHGRINDDWHIETIRQS